MRYCSSLVRTKSLSKMKEQRIVMKINSKDFNPRMKTNKVSNKVFRLPKRQKSYKLRNWIRVIHLNKIPLDFSKTYVKVEKFYKLKLSINCLRWSVVKISYEIHKDWLIPHRYPDRYLYLPLKTQFQYVLNFLLYQNH